MTTSERFALRGPGMDLDTQALTEAWLSSEPFKHIVLDNFLGAASAEFLSSRFPNPESGVWLDWTKRSPSQYGKQGPGNADRFHLLDDGFNDALAKFNSGMFLQYIGRITGIDCLLPDPYFTGGGMHQILQGGILDIHTDFNYYRRLNIYRRLNVILYLTKDWQPDYGGALELWTAAPLKGGSCFKEIAPVFNRLVIFETDKSSFHGHPREWSAPDGLYRRSIALYYYTAEPISGKVYDENTDFQSYVLKVLSDA